MYIRLFILLSIVIGSVGGICLIQAASDTNIIPMYAWIGCDGTAVTRTGVGKIVITHIAPNLPNCNGANNAPIVTSTGSHDTPVSIDSTTTNSDSNIDEDAITISKKSNVILLDLAQKDIVNYRVELIRQKQIRYANAIRSVRIRQGRSLESNTKGYLIKNSAVQVTGKTTGWTPVKSGEVVVTDVRENTVSIDTSTGKIGYVGTKYLRNANPSDLVKIGQADIAYWTDIVHTNVAHLVNIRNNPWYTAPIVQTVQSDLPMYRVATVDNWSQVQSIDGSLNGFIRSDFLVVDKKQLVEQKPLLK